MRDGVSSLFKSLYPPIWVVADVLRAQLAFLDGSEYTRIIRCEYIRIVFRVYVPIHWRGGCAAAFVLDSDVDDFVWLKWR